MLHTPQSTFLLASNDPILLGDVEPVLLALGGRVQIVLSAEAALTAMTQAQPPGLVLLDARVPGMEMGRLLATVRAETGGHRFPIVLFSDTLSEEWKARLTEGVIDELLPLSLSSELLGLRIEMAVHSQRRTEEAEMLREAALRNEQSDRLTGAYTRDAVLSLLARETDRVQRMNTSLCVILFDIDDFEHWNAQLGRAECDGLLVQVVGRVANLLRSYDLLGRVGGDEFLAGLPGCSAVNAVLLAERIRMEVFSAPFQAAGRGIRLSACFAVAASQGRSPVVVLREAEEALRAAKAAGPEQIQCAGDCPEAKAAPVGFLSLAAADDLLGW